MSKKLLILIIVVFISSCKRPPSDILYSSDSYTLYRDKVVQGKNVAEVKSPFHITSNYRSPASSTFPRLLTFKFSINEKDNELPPGANHWVVIDEGNRAPVVTFGEKPGPLPDTPSDYLPTNYEYTFLLDVSPVLRQFEEKGYYEAWDGSRVAEADFQGFYIAGGAEPLTWDFVNLGNQGLEMKPTEEPHIYSITVQLNPYNEEDYRDKEWKPELDVSDKPQYQSDQPIVDALFNLSLEEARKNIEPDSTLRTGAEWGGVWTRDVSYSVLLAFAYHEPEVAKISLRKKVRRGRIVQDTGSGGAWPVSSDRTTWVLAAWEIYKVTGDRDWLNEVYPIIKNTLEDDYKTLYDEETGLYRGESSFLDWREQTYPKWMDNRDIYESQNLGTNVVHYQAHRILAEMARIKGEPYEKYEMRAYGIKKGINALLWLKEQGFYAQYLYGRDRLITSPRFEALGEALAVLFEVADEERAASIMARSPLTEFGATCIYPQIPGIPPYHNNGIWPFVQSYWNWAAAKTGNEAVLNHGLASIYRAAGLFLTNYENMVAETGDFLGTEVNSERMLWSMAGNLAMVHRIFMGMEFETDGLYLNPVVPEVYGGKKVLSRFPYREATLDITVLGHGNRIKSVTINGEQKDRAFVPADATGEYSIVIELAGGKFPHNAINRVENAFSPATVLSRPGRGPVLEWDPVDKASEYKVYRNGKLDTILTDTQYRLKSNEFSSLMVSAVDSLGREGFASEPIFTGGQSLAFEIEDVADASDLPYVNYSGSGFVELSLQRNRDLVLPVSVPEEASFLVDFRYSNGSGRWNTDNKCAIRSLSLNGEYQGALIMPQRGQDEWSDWGFTNSFRLTLRPGRNTIRIHLADWNNNMNVKVNTAMLDAMRLIRID